MSNKKKTIHSTSRNFIILFHTFCSTYQKKKKKNMLSIDIIHNIMYLCNEFQVHETIKKK